MLRHEELWKDFVVGQRDDIRHAAELGELPRRLETPCLLLLDPHSLARRERVECGTERSRETAGVEHDQRPFVPRARALAAVITSRAGDGYQRHPDDFAHVWDDAPARETAEGRRNGKGIP